MRWYVGWRIDRIMPMKIFETGNDEQHAFQKMTHHGLLAGKIHQKVYGPYSSFGQARLAYVPLPSSSA